MSSKPGTYDLTDMNWGLGIGCTFSIVLMIFSWVCFCIELYKFFTYTPPPRTSTPSVPVAPPTASVLPSSMPQVAGRLYPTAIMDDPPPPYHSVISERSSPRSSILHEPSAPSLDPLSHSRSRRRSPSPIRPSAPLPDVVVSGILYDPIRSISVSRDADNCLLSVCKEYFQTLQLNRYFQDRSDCYCPHDYPNSNPKTYTKGGHEYTIPCGWVRFRIKTDRTLSQTSRLFHRWATSYYGTCEEKLEPILRNPPMPLPGDTLIDDKTFSDHSGFDQQWLTSPSINYVSNARFSPMKTFISQERRGVVYNVQVVLQCKQKPGTFTIQPGRSGLCNLIAANEIEWRSNHRTTLIPNGLMIRMMRR